MEVEVEIEQPAPADAPAPAEAELQARIARQKAEMPLRYLPYLLLLFGLGLLHITNNYWVEKRHHRIFALKKQVEERKMDYRAIKYDYMQETRSKRIQEKALQQGLYPRQSPPVLIKVSSLSE